MSIVTITSSKEPLKEILCKLPQPVLVVSTHVGRGMYTLGEALVEQWDQNADVIHRPIEGFLPAAGLQEDVDRYRWISSYFPFLLNLPYRLPAFYWRKLWRERHFSKSDLSKLNRFVAEHEVRSIVCVSHRPAFWVSCWKTRYGANLPLIGLLGEYGRTLGWRFLEWDAVDVFLTPVPLKRTGLTPPKHTCVLNVELPARQAFSELARKPGDPNSTLVVCGFWGQGPLQRVVAELLDLGADIRVTAICGENHAAQAAIQSLTKDFSRLSCHGVVDSLLPFMQKCGSIVSKPGISTLLEACAARRKIFLLKGMPVAEDNNMRHALRYFDASVYSRDNFLRWHHDQLSGEHGEVE